MIKLLNHRPAGRITAAFGNTHGDKPSREICDFCGETVVKHLKFIWETTTNPNEKGC